MTAKPKRGRPRRTKKVAGKVLGIRLTDAERAALEARAAYVEQDLSVWAREVLLFAAGATAVGPRTKP